MRWGCCGSMIAPATDPIGIESVQPMADCGFDYAELSLAHAAALSEDAFEALAARLAASGLPCEACNNFFPPSVRLTGPAANLGGALDYATVAIRRAARLGARVIVFGSSGAKNVPEGFDPAEARRQLVRLLCGLAPIAQRHGVTIAIEPISRPESNLINTAAEGLRLMREVAHPSIRLLIDFYHLVRERETPAIVLEAGPAVAHVHFARIEGRSFPVEWNESYGVFFENLRRAGYDGRCSIEAFTTNFETDAKAALGALKTKTGGASSWTN